MLLDLSSSRHHGHLWEISRPPTSQTPQLAMSPYKNGANAMWHLNPAGNFVHEDRIALLQGWCPQTCPGSCSIAKPVLEQAWYLLFGDYKFFLPVFLKTLSRSKETLQKKLTSITPKEIHTKTPILSSIYFTQLQIKSLSRYKALKTSHSKIGTRNIKEGKTEAHHERTKQM